MFGFFITLSLLVSSSSYIVEVDSIFERYYESGVSDRIEYRRIRVLRDDLEDQLRSIIASYTPCYNEIQFDFARIVRGRDTIYLDTSLVVDVPAPPELGGTIYWGTRNKIMEVKGLSNGDVLEYRIRRYGGNWLGPTGSENYKTPYPGFFNQIELFGGYEEIKKKVYVLQDLPEKPVRFGIFNGRVKYRKVKSSGSVFHIFESRDNIKLDFEPFAPSRYDILPKVIVTNIPSWRDISKYEYERSEENLIPDDFVTRTSDSLCSGVSDNSEKIRRLFYFVSDQIRYLGLIESEMEGYEPHKASLTLAKKSGVCKDKAALLVSLLRAQGFKAYYATTAVGMRVEDIPSDQTNHAIVAIEVGPDTYVYLDPTVGSGGRDLMPASEGGQGVLVSRKEGDILRKISSSVAESNRVVVSILSAPRAETLDVILKIRFEGGFDQQFRRIARSGHKNLERYFRRALSEIYKGEIILDSLECSDSYDYSDYFSVAVYAKALNHIQRIGELLLYRPVLAFLGDRFAGFLDFLNEKRKYDLSLRYPFKVEINEVISGIRPNSCPRMKVQKGNKDLYLLSFSAVSDSNTIEFKLHYSFNKSRFSAVEARKLYSDHQAFSYVKNYTAILNGGKER